MQVSFTEASSSLNGSRERLDFTLVTCTETMTFTEVVEDEDWGSFYYSFKTEQLVTLWILFIVTVAGNSIVLLSTWKRKRKSRMTFFVTQLAITGIMYLMTYRVIIFCKMGEARSQTRLCRMSSVARVHQQQTCTLPMLRQKVPVHCGALPWDGRTFFMPYMGLIILFSSSLPTCSVIYFIVIRTIWMKSKPHAAIISNCTDGRFCASYTHRGIISKAKVKAIKYSIVIILAFVLCWSPYFLFDILDNFNVLPQTKKRFYASVIIQNLPSLNSAVNPLIYCIFSNILCRPFFGRARNLGGTFKDRTDGQEMQAVSKPEYI
uniref:G-protein coupled receptors family 1 profile domain-containing protein n=1 Tax=Terrapene triunguis TaxID=2587831 RepID=A0A674KGE6_9SAUR